MSKKILSVILVLVMSLALALPAYAFTDINSSFAKDELTEWSKYDVIHGYADDTMRPNDPITRGAMATMLNNLMGYQVRAKNNFKDLKNVPTANALLRASAAGIVNGDQHGNANPYAPATRAQTAVMLSRVMNLNTTKSRQTTLNKFTDRSSIGNWCAPAIAEMVNRGFINGFPDGSFRPNANVTRAQFVKMLDNIFEGVFVEAGTYSKNVDGNVIVTQPNTTLEDMKIKGDLLIAEGVGNGDVDLDSIEVTGDTIVRGGGEDSIHVKGTTSLSNVIVDKTDGNVRVAVEGRKAEIETIVIQNGEDDVIVDGDVETIQVIAPDVPVTVQNGTVDEIIVDEEAEGAEISVAEGAVVETLIDSAEDSFILNAGVIEKVETTESAKNAQIDTKKGASTKSVEANAVGTEVTGKGAVGNVEAKADDVSVDTKGTEVEADKGISGVTAGDKTVKAGKTVTAKGDMPSVDKTNSEAAKDAHVDTTDKKSSGSSHSGGSHHSSSDEKVTSVRITGKATVGQTLTAVPTPSDATVSYQWMHSDNASEEFENISGATSEKYTLTNDDLNKYIKVVVDGTGSYTGTKTSTATAKVTEASSEDVEIVSEQMKGLPTSEVKVKVDDEYVSTFDLYFDGGLLASTTDGKVVVASAVLLDLSRVEIKTK